MTLPPAVPAEMESRRGMRAAFGAIIAIAAVIHGVRIAQAPPLQSANDRSRWCTVWSLIERGTYQIDEIRRQPGWDTIDLVRIDGHFYSSKPPLMSTWVAGVTWAVCRVTGWSLLDHPQAVMSTTLLIVNGIPFVLMLILLARVLEQSALAPSVAMVVLSFAAFGTLWSPFLASLNNHTVAACGAFLGGVSWLWAADSLPNGRRSLIFSLWGLAASAMACHDLPAGLMTLVFGWQACRIDFTRAVGYFGGGAALPVLALVGTNMLALGTWRPAYSGYGSETYVFIHEGIPSYWANPQGVDRNLDTPLLYAFHSTLGHHGFLSLTPMWLFVIWGAVHYSPRVPAALRSLSRSILLVTLLLLAFYLSRTENYNYGGVSCGLRWALVMVPLWTLALIPALTDTPWRWPKRTVLALVLSGSVYSAWEPGLKPWQQPWLFKAMEQAGWFHYREAPPPWDQSLYTWFPKLPVPTEQEPHPWVQWERDGDPSHALRLKLIGEETIGGKSIAVLEATDFSVMGGMQTRVFRIDRAAFSAGRPPGEFLRWTEADITPTGQQADLAWVRSLPLLKAYNPGHIRYLKTGLRTDALECQRAAAQVEVPATASAPVRRHRTDVWLCAELPFGVARRDISVSDPVTGAILQQQSWIVTGCSPAVAEKSPLTVETIRARQAQPGKPLAGIR